jgi:hypothetical protein
MSAAELSHTLKWLSSVLGFEVERRLHPTTDSPSQALEWEREGKTEYIVELNSLGRSRHRYSFARYNEEEVLRVAIGKVAEQYPSVDVLVALQPVPIDDAHAVTAGFDTMEILDAIQIVLNKHGIDWSIEYIPSTHAGGARRFISGWKVSVGKVKANNPLALDHLTSVVKDFRAALVLTIWSLVRQLPQEPLLDSFRSEGKNIH